MVYIISQLHQIKTYQLETFYKAVSIADRYLASLARREKIEEAPSVVNLATLSVLVAAKLDQPISPSFTRMLTCLPPNLIPITTKQDLINLETLLVRELDFDL